MTATVFMTNTITVEWSDMSLPFSLSMLVMLLVRTTIYGFLIGALIVAGGNLWMLITKYKGILSK